MPQYYGVQRSDEYLAHYGVKGMKWGVRKALERGSDRALARQYRKANRKLNKLMKLGTNKSKYAKKAAIYGTGAATLAGLTAAGTGGVGTAIERLATASLSRSARVRTGLKNLANNTKLNGTVEGTAINNLANNLWDKAVSRNSNRINTSLAVKDYGQSDSIIKKLTAAQRKKKYKGYKDDKMFYTTKYNTTGPTNSALPGVSNDTLLRIATGVGAAGLGAAAIRNAYRAKTADRNIIKAAQFKRAMDETFAGTKYANGVPVKKKKSRRR